MHIASMTSLCGRSASSIAQLAALTANLIWDQVQLHLSCRVVRDVVSLSRVDIIHIIV